ncbi:hypothetical protein HUO13_05780 [Saccharopolyspora erythraea]|uniref:hypothetical protein n=1 Tax=Saccharopolyspora erythraea TaxID=1836 RepID=UPI001BAA15C8|nr:hypothetical protein [Saccharopolyspora erythraea]QUH00391.1 hypothetical protein HUO13_05780 [Saccharopolyspora erythraea]
MAGFRLDEAALEGAIARLKELQERTLGLFQNATELKPGELTAGDATTNTARQKIQERATGNEGSLRMVANQLHDKLKEKVAAYETTLREYRAAEENATVDAGRVEWQA